MVSEAWANPVSKVRYAFKGKQREAGRVPGSTRQLRKMLLTF